MGMKDPKGGFSIKAVKLERSKKRLVSRAGLHGLLQIFDTTELGKEFGKCMPEDGSNRAYGGYQLGLLWIACLLSGFDCIDDIEEFDDDDLILALFDGKLPTAKTMGNFLRRFSDENIKGLNRFLTKMGFTLREHSKRVHPHKSEVMPHFKIDGTIHEQHGNQMEGCGWITKSEGVTVYGYASQVVFDEMGFCYAAELLAAAHPKGDAPALLDQVLSPLRGKKIENPFEKIADVSGDSAYLTEDVIRTITSHHATFTIAAAKTIQWHTQLDKLTWESWDYTDEQIKKLRARKRTPQECLLARWHWSPGWADEKLLFPVIIKKEWRPDEVLGEVCGSYHYHAVATNRDLLKQNYQSIVEAYRPRAEVENAIKEFKIGFDGKHLPCLKKSANEVYLLLVLISQNLIRWAAIIDRPDKPHYAKKIRRKLINAPAMLLTGSRYLTLKVKEKFLKEVNLFLERWRSHSVTIPPLMFSTA
jgi:hypothetical protein